MKSFRKILEVQIYLGMFLILLSCNSKNIQELDYSNILVKAKEFASKELTEDGFGKKYDSSKPWFVLNKFIENKDLNYIRKVINNDTNLIAVNKKLLDLDSTFFFVETDELKKIYDFKKLFKAENDFYLVRFLVPKYNPVSNEYISFIWLKDHSWTSGFHLYFTFQIVNKKIRLTTINNSTSTHIEE